MSLTTLALALLSTAPAEASPLDLTWTAPAACPDAEAIEGRVLDAIGDTQREPPLEVIGEVTETPDGFTMAVTIVGDASEGTRTLPAATCDELADAAVLIMAIAIDPRAIERLEQPEPEPEPQPEPLPEPEPEPEPEPLPEPEPEPDPEPQPPPEPAPEPQPPRQPWDIHLDAVVTPGVAIGVFPTVTGWFGAGLGLEGRNWRVELDGTINTPVERTSEANPDITGRFLLGAAVARGCPVLHSRDVDIPICLGIEVGAMRGRGDNGVDTPQTQNALWVGALGGVAAIWRPQRLGERFGFGVRAEGVAGITQPKFETQPSGEVFRAGRGGGRFGAIFAIRLR